MRTVSGQKRKRDAHDHQSVPLRGKRSTAFMKAVGEPVTIGGFSKMEFLVVCSIVQSPLADESGTWNCDWDRAKNIDISKIHWMYTSILTLAETQGLELSLYSRTQEQIRKLLKVSVFKHQPTYYVIIMHSILLLQFFKSYYTCIFHSKD